MVYSVAVHCCGYHLAALQWEKVVWGAPENRVNARLSQALQLAQEHDAQLLIGTGASNIEGVLEARMMQKYGLQQLNEAHKWHSILTSAILDESSQNTQAELAHSIAYCQQHNISKLLVVSSPWHIFRAHQQALLAVVGTDVQIMAVASQDDVLPLADVVMVEPAHRPDDANLLLPPHLQRHALVKRMFQVKRPRTFAYGTHFLLNLLRY